MVNEYWYAVENAAFCLKQTTGLHNSVLEANCTVDSHIHTGATGTHDWHLGGWTFCAIQRQLSLWFVFGGSCFRLGHKTDILLWYWLLSFLPDLCQWVLESCTKRLRSASVQDWHCTEADLNHFKIKINTELLIWWIITLELTRLTV